MTKLKIHVSKVDSFKEYSNPDNLTTYEYRLILKTFNYLLMMAIVETGERFLLPKNCGLLWVQKMPVKGRGIFDYQLYAKTGQKVYKKNLHSEGWAARFIWDPSFPFNKLPTQKRSLYVYHPPRGMKRYLAKKIKESNYINKYYDY